MTGAPAFHFIPASSSAASGAGLPLARYLPLLPHGVVSAWLAERVPPGGWVLDPLGTTPALALEAARAGYRVIVASNNPILSFMLEVLAAAHRPADFQAALAELALSKRGDERLDRHLQNLYQTDCPRCGEIFTAQGYLWRKGEAQPFARVGRCPKCGEEGDQPLSPLDLERLAQVGNDTLHRSRALQRVVMNEDDFRQDVEEALENYQPRPLSVLFTLINRLEGLSIPPERARLMQALLISAFDAGSTLWPWPAARAHPRQLGTPPQFRENNLWSALERAAADWSAPDGSAPVTVTRWPELPPERGGICLYRGRVKGLMPLPEPIDLTAIASVFPRPNQAFWTLSALWSGWLWGREAALPLRNVLDRRRYDWNWHASALHSALSALSRTVRPQALFLGLLPGVAPGFLAAAVTACESAGFRLEGLALQAEEGMAQGLWRPASRLEPDVPPNDAALEGAARAAIRAALVERAEPAPYLALYAAGLSALARAGAIPERGPGLPGEVFTRLQAALARPFSDRSFLKFYPAAGGAAQPTAESADEARGWWWLANAPGEGDAAPLADRVEMEVVRFLQKQPTCSLEDVQHAIAPRFPGLLAPPADLLRACLDSYGEPVPAGAGLWRLCGGEAPSERRADLKAMRAALLEIARRMGCQASAPGEGPVTWDNGWSFFLLASSIVSRFVLAPGAPPPGRRVLVLPGSRARLLASKLRRDPRLAEAMQGWRILKFRQLRAIALDFAGRDPLTITDWEAALEQDPLTDEATQIPLFL